MSETGRDREVTALPDIDTALNKTVNILSRINDVWGSFQVEQHAVAQEVADSYGTSLGRDEKQLHPRPTKDPKDPLNWTAYRKHTILALVMWMYFMFAYITTTTIPSFPDIQQQYNLTYSQVNWTVGVPSIGLSLGPLFWSSMSDIYGRRLVFIVGTLIALFATIGTATSGNYPLHLTARFFQGFGASPGGTVGMAIVNDLFFDYERGQKLGLWVLAINSGLFIGPIVGGFMDMVSMVWVDWVTAILFLVLLILELAFLPETLYPRHLMLAEYTSAESGHQPSETKPEQMRRTTTLPFINVAPIPGIKHPRPWDSMLRFGRTFQYPVVVLTVSVFCFSWYWWILSIITQIPAAYPDYSPSDQGLLFVGLLEGALFAELCCSGKLGDSLVQRMSKRTGIRAAEARLWLAYPAAFLSAAGLIIWGISVEKQYHCVVGQVAFFLFMMGVQMGNTAITSYVVDCYPLQSMSIITFYSVLLDLSAFINPFFIAAWVDKHGYIYTFGTQGIITFCVAVPAIALIHTFGPRMRAKSGNPGWVNPEYDVL